MLPFRASCLPGMVPEHDVGCQPRDASVSEMPVCLLAMLGCCTLSWQASRPSTSAASGVRAAPQVGLAQCNALLLWLAHLAVLALCGRLCSCRLLLSVPRLPCGCLTYVFLILQMLCCA